MTRQELNNLRYLAKCVGSAEWNTGPETGAGHVWLYRGNRATGEPAFKMRGDEPGYRNSSLERQHQAQLIVDVLNALPFLLDAAESKVKS